LIVYIPRYFSEEDETRLFEFIDEVAVGTLITAGPAGLMANEVPLLQQPRANRLWGHLARPNQQLLELAAVDEVLINVTGPTGYISPSWYRTPGLVPTWNFITVQVRGRPVIHDDMEEVLDIVRRLSEKHESQFDYPWTLDKVESEKLEKMLGVIVGFHIEIDDIRGKFKLSQNREAADHASVIAGLESVGNNALANAMKAAEPGEQ
jgi:transcriptional regulator